MRRYRLFQGVLILWASLLVIGKANAADSDWYIVPGLIYIAPDSDRKAEDDIGLQIGIGKSVTPIINVEWNWIQDTLAQKVHPLQFKQQGWSLDGIRFYKPMGTLSRYLLLGIGTLKTEFSNQERYRLIAQFGGGVMRPFWGSDRILIRGDLRYRIDERGVPPHNSFGDGVVHIGLILPLDRHIGTASLPTSPHTPTSIQPTKQAPAFIPPPADTKDTDRDGVPDGSDSCPSTPPGTPVNDIGC